MKTLLAAAVMALALAPPVLAQPAPIDPRARTEAIAAAIQQEYFDESKGRRIADELRAEAAKGAYDGLKDPRDFAGALTERLKPQDGHFQVSWSPSQAGAPDRPAFDPAKAAAAARRINYGFRAVQVLPGNIGYIDLRQFAHFEGDGPARAAADAAMALIAGTDAVIVDLRFNGGGSPAMVGYLASWFVPPGADIYNTFKSRGPDTYERPTAEIRGARRLEVPLYILVSGRTGSAAESFAYTLQAARRATIVGDHSAGGANPGGVNPIGDGLQVFVSSGSPVNPITGANWEGTGVVPDVEASPDQALVRAQILALRRIAQAPLAEPAATEVRWILEALDKPRPTGPTVLARYAGDYGPYAVTLAGDRLVLRQGRRPPTALDPLAEPGLFAVDGAPTWRIRFETPGAGPASALVSMGSDGSAARQPRTRPGQP
ncbi:S41 family peptidase [Phenylobacterium sp.]|uniref:S41 family peptidase n=1 Tax=Phenylobacterium sp. TaxID=1871053 RepID=UPI002FC5E0C0